jgi:hypothetical protein
MQAPSPQPLGAPTQAPSAEQTCPFAHAPQVPPQPSAPHARPSQAGTQRHCPSAEQTSSLAQRPQVPPQPSDPQALPPQSGAHTGTQARVSALQASP